MHSHHKKLLAEIQKHRGRGNAHTTNDSYLLSGHVYHDVSVPIRRRIAKDWLRENKGITSKEFIAVLDSLYRGKSHEEKTLASFLLGYAPQHRKRVDTRELDR